VAIHHHPRRSSEAVDSFSLFPNVYRISSRPSWIFSDPQLFLCLEMKGQEAEAAVSRMSTPTQVIHITLGLLSATHAHDVSE
jgi:hypothetical protein